NISSDCASVTVRLELEASQMIARMLGYGPDSWAHLTSGGAIADLEALWIARTGKYFPLGLGDMRRAVGLPPQSGPGDPAALLRLSPTATLEALARCFREAERLLGATPETERRLIRAYLDSSRNVVEQGLPALCSAVESRPIILAPETHHYCFEKAMDAL